MKPLFIAGPARSGTTITAALLDGHQEILVWPFEFYFFTSFWGSIAKGKTARFRDIIPYAEKIISPFSETETKNSFSTQFLNGKVDIKKLRQNLCENTDQEREFDAIDFFIHLGHCFASAHTDYVSRRPKYFAMKTMLLGVDWNRFDEMPDTQVIMTTRPAQECYMSSKDKAVVRQGRDVSDWLMTEGTEVLLRLRFARFLAEARKDDPRFQFVSLSDLKGRSEEILRTVMSKLEVDWDESSLKPTFLGNPFGGHFADADLNVGAIVDASSNHSEPTMIETLYLRYIETGEWPTNRERRSAILKSAGEHAGTRRRIKSLLANYLAGRQLRRLTVEKVLSCDLTASRGALAGSNPFLRVAISS